MAMYESLFDLSPEQTDSTAMPRTVVFSNETGSGSMPICPLLPGAELYYNDMHLVSFDEAPVLARNVIEINHCRVGRYECSFGENSCCYLAAGDFAVCAAARKKSSSCFPLRHYHGITILLDLDAVSPEMRSQMEWYGVNLNAIRQYICTENRCCILRSAPVVAHVFSELYTAHAVPDTGYLRLKVMELLHILSRLKDRDDVLNVFIHGDMPEKIQRISRLYHVSEQEAVKLIADTDKRRMTNYNFYTEQKWGKASNYTLSLNSSQLGYDRCEKIIMECICNS